jgi:flagellar protein FlaG
MMLNPSIDVYGSGKPLANLQSAAGLQASSVNSVGLKPLNTARAEGKPAAEVDKTELDAAVKKLNEFVAPALQSIQFSVDTEANRVVVKVIDTATQKVLRQMPNEEVLAFSKSLDSLKGLLIRQTA